MQLHQIVPNAFSLGDGHDLERILKVGKSITKIDTILVTEKSWLEKMHCESTDSLEESYLSQVEVTLISLLKTYANYHSTMNNNLLTRDEFSTFCKSIWN